MTSDSAPARVTLPDKVYGGYIFDLDGTLVDSMPTHHRAWLHALRNNGAPPHAFLWDEFVAHGGMAAPDIPSFSYGLKGLCCFELEVSAPCMDLHSGVFGGSVANPITTLCEMIATTHDADNHITVEGFYDGVSDIEQWEKDSWKRVPGMSDAELAELTGVPCLRTRPATPVQSACMLAPRSSSTVFPAVTRVRAPRLLSPPRLLPR